MELQWKKINSVNVKHSDMSDTVLLSDYLEKISCLFDYAEKVFFLVERTRLLDTHQLFEYLLGTLKLLNAELVRFSSNETCPKRECDKIENIHLRLKEVHNVFVEYLEKIGFQSMSRMSTAKFEDLQFAIKLMLNNKGVLSSFFAVLDCFYFMLSKMELCLLQSFENVDWTDVEESVCELQCHSCLENVKIQLSQCSVLYKHTTKLPEIENESTVN